MTKGPHLDLDNWDKEKFSKDLTEACGERTKAREIAEYIMDDPVSFTPREVLLAGSYLHISGAYGLVKSLLNFYRHKFGDPSEWQ